MEVIFVCTGNTCRSPMAEGYLKSLNLPALSVKSRALFGGGDRVSENSAEALGEIGIDISEHISRQFTDEDTKANRIICMTNEHRAILVRAGVAESRLSVLGGGIPDPYGGALPLYRATRNAITDSIDALVFGGFFTEFTVTTASTEDIPAIAALEKKCFAEPWSENAIAEGMAAKTRFFVAKQSGEVLGYGGVSIVCGEGYITNIAVSESARKRGVGSYLLARIITECRECGAEFVSLEVRASNQTAQSIYHKAGFEKAGERKNFYSSPKEDALIMTKRF